MSKKNRLKKKEAAALAAIGTNSPAARGIFRWLLPAAAAAWFYWVYRNYLPAHPAVSSFPGTVAGFDFISAFSGFFSVLPSNALNLLWLAALVIVARGLGGLLLSLFRLALPPAESSIYAVGLGFGAFAYLMLLLGASGALYRSVVLALFLAGFAVCAVKLRIWTFRVEELGREAGAAVLPGFSWKVPVFITALFLLLNAVMAFTPEIFYDSLVYHLAVPNYYLLKHEILPMRFLCHSNFPLNISMIHMLSLALSGELLAKMVHCLMGALTAAQIYLLVKGLYNARAALFSAVIFCSTPIFAMNAWTCGNDVGVVFFFTLALTAYLRWLKSGETGFFALAAVFSGISAGSKYTAAFSVAGMAVSMAVHLWRNHGFGAAVKKLSLYFGTVFLFVLPWLVKNYIFTRNPFQPFLYGPLGGENLKVMGSGTGGLINTQQNLVNLKFTELLSSPWTLTHAGGDSLTHLGPVFLLFLPALLLFRKMDRPLKHALLMFCAGYLFWYTGTPAYRYMLSLFVALSICLGWAVSLLSERSRPFRLLAAGVFALSFAEVFSIAASTGLGWYFARGVSRDEFLSVSQPLYPNPPYAAIQWINRSLPPDAKVFFMAESRPFYIKRDFLSYSVETNLPPFMVYLRKAKDAGDFYALLRAEKFTHLLVNYREAARNSGPYREFDWTAGERAMFDAFWKAHVRQEYFKEGVYVYSLHPAGNSYPPPLNILEELEKDGWKNESLQRIYARNRLWAGSLEEYEMIARYGYNVKKQIEYFRTLLANEKGGIQ